jgi:hypothetical protein
VSGVQIPPPLPVILPNKRSRIYMPKGAQLAHFSE